MLRKKTVFVVGAGASRELDLPIGEDLKGWIADSLKTTMADFPQRFENIDIQRAVETLSGSGTFQQSPDTFAEYVQAAEAIRDALPFALSIDQYLDSQRANKKIVQLGKVAIANCILRAERDSLIASRRINDIRLQKLSKSPDWGALKTWHLKLVQLLTAGRPKSELINIFEDVSFIIFNYDRCLEFYFENALTRYYGAESRIVHETLKRVQIIHPYGQVGYFDWQSGPQVPYGGRAENSLHEVAEGLKTFTESAAEGTIRQVKTLIEEAETLAFMGFGFLPQNVELLRTNKVAEVKRIFYTTYGISRSDIEFVDRDLELIVGKEADLLDLNRPDSFERFEEEGRCADLMNNNWMRLTR